MKKIYYFISLTLLSLVLSQGLSAQERFRVGVKGGVNFINTDLGEFKVEDLSEKRTGFNLGIVWNLRLPLGLSVQPELLYAQHSTSLASPSSATRLSVTQGVIEVPVAIQWGIKLGPVRPFVQASPYVGLTVANFGNLADDPSKTFKNELPWQYGIGLGFGVDFFNLQLSFKYKWGLASFDYKEIEGTLLNTSTQNAEVTLALFF